MVVKVESEEIREVRAASQNYDWGIIGSNSLVAKLAAGNSKIKIDEGKPYAELWMGTHPNAASSVFVDNNTIPLKDILKEDLPFLFKVLSVGKALSIQAHPDQELAKVLHQRDPKNYRDPNHKPEMAIALTPFEALCGFRPIDQIVSFCETVPELKYLVSVESFEKLKNAANGKNDEKDALKSFFKEFIAAPTATVQEAINSFVNRLTSINRPTEVIEELCLRLNAQYPAEVGCFCVFLFNYITMKPGEAIFLAANEPHAYLSGECIECMALSDNVVRAGLTPKYRDVDTLVQMLTYKTYTPEDLSMKPIKISNNTVSYIAPVKEFSVNKIRLSLGEKETIAANKSDSILICVQGELAGVPKAEFQLGSILYLPKGSTLEVISKSSESLLFQAFSNQ